MFLNPFAEMYAEKLYMRRFGQSYQNLLNFHQEILIFCRKKEKMAIIPLASKWNGAAAPQWGPPPSRKVFNGSLVGNQC